MTTVGVDLTDDQWAVLEPLVPRPRVRPDGRGRPWRDPRDVLNSVLWVLKTPRAIHRGAPGAADWRPCLRQRRPRSRTRRPGRRADRATPTQPDEAEDAGRPTAAPVEA